MLTPVAVYGLEVPCDGDIMPAVGEFPATFRITMAAIDPSAEVKTEKGVVPRATLKILREPIQPPQDDDDDEDYMRSLLEGGSDEESSDDDEAGPSDKKARKEKALKELMAQLAQDNEDSDEEMADAGSKKKGKAVKAEDEDSEEESDDEEDMEIEEFVLCTLDPKNNYQVPLDITVGEDERVFFKVTGTHNVYLTGNYLIPDDEANTHRKVYDSDEDDSENDEDYDLSPDEDELDDEEDSEDDLDDMEDPRVVELEDDEEEAPKLVKGKNKRAAEESLDEIMEKTATKGKKAKTNEGKAVAAESPKDGKSVKFAKNLEQGPTGSEAKKAAEKPAEKPKAALGVKTVKGVKIDDKKLGSGPAAKNGDRVGMRYIGKLTDGKVFDANKKGKPFSFKLGAGEVIKGWDIGIAGMQVGGERRLTVPANLAYGSKALPGIPSNSTLVFDVKMLEIK